MAETVDQALADISAAQQKQAADLTKLKTDVAALLAAFQNATPGQLTAAQQIALDALKTAMGVDDTTITDLDTTITDLDTSVTSATPPAG